MESFAPSVVVDGKTVTPPGWMWVVVFAIRECEWAIKECEKPEFDKIVKDWFIEREIRIVTRDINNLLEKLNMYVEKYKELKAKLEKR